MILDLSRKEVVEFYCEELMSSVLLDSGAFISVFTRTEDSLKSKFNNVINTGCKTIVGGFGGNGNIVPVYIIPKLSIGSITIFNLPVAVYSNNNITADLILSSYVFKNNEFTVNFKNRILEVRERDIHCLLIKEGNLVTKFTVFAQEEIQP